jgi:hypothetical protein
MLISSYKTFSRICLFAINPKFRNVDSVSQFQNLVILWLASRIWWYKNNSFHCIWHYVDNEESLNLFHDIAQHYRQFGTEICPLESKVSCLCS